MPKTLLLADDSVTIQRVVELSFANEDVRVVSVGDGRRAMQWMESESPDIVLADVEVPEVDGYALTSHIRQSARLKGVPVLLLAGAFEPVDQDRIQQIGCDGVMVKPFEPQQLVSKVKTLLSQPPGERDARRKRSSDPATVTAFPGSGPVETLELPNTPVWEGSSKPPATGEKPEAQGGAPKVSLVNAFSALLAAEQSNPAAQPPAQAALSDATIEDAVRRVLVRMTDDLVRRIVVDTAERLIREELEKIKNEPE